jgi:hypothetical protein
MTKKLVAIPEGNLMRIAATKGITTLFALWKKTGVDRKTLRKINTGQPVREKTLQDIEKRLRVPLPHLLGKSTLDEVENSGGLDTFQIREIKLQQLDGAALRRLAGETDQITWLLKMDQMSESLEATLLKLRDSLQRWCHHLATFGTPDLVDQISSIKASTDINQSVEQLAEQNLKIYGGTYVVWKREPPFLRVMGKRYPGPDLIYTSQTEVLLSIAPEKKNNSTVRVSIGWEPPQKFIASELAGIDSVKIDGRQVWTRDENDELPF